MPPAESREVVAHFDDGAFWVDGLDGARKDEGDAQQYPAELGYDLDESLFTHDV